jgi:hypothetical protein
VWVFLGFAFGVMLAVNADEIGRFHASTDPKPEAEKMRNNGVQIKRTVRHGTVQIDRDACNRDVCGEKRVKHDFPPSGLAQAMRHPLDQGLRHGVIKKFHTDWRVGTRFCEDVSFYRVAVIQRTYL